MSAEIPAEFDARIEKSEYAWFTTVRADGMPQPTPVWFIREGDTFLLYTIPDSQKVKNIRANPKIALGVSNEDAEEYVVIMGEARVDESTPPADQVPAYLAKYRQGIADIGYTPETFVQMWSLPIRVTPTHVRGQLDE